MVVKHIVLFQFKADVAVETQEEATSRMLGLKEGCLNASQKPYIKSLVGGRDNSIEGASNGITHAFIVEFESIEDRNYYVNSDKHHGEFKSFIVPFLEKFTIVDFSEGVF
ncbi:stress responsive A/B barrel domain protein [Daldinia sp. FL1419]|nr:stress responsive A/B barrel domain protein [Daldinia sp. FL1419]